LDIYCLNVGQGDSTLVVSSSGKSLLIDGGPNDPAASVVVPFLRSLGLTSLDYTVATCYDPDHIGGLDEVGLSEFRPEIAYDRGGGASDNAFLNYYVALVSRRRTLSSGQVLDLGAGVTATCHCINGELSDGFAFDLENERDRSVGLLIEWEDFDFWISGDLGGGGATSFDMESEVAYLVGDVDVLRVNRHGGGESSNEIFLNELRPEVSIISVGPSNPSGDPAQEVLDRLAEFGSFQRIVQTTPGAGGSNNSVLVADDHIHIHVTPSKYRVTGGPVDFEIPLLVERNPPDYNFNLTVEASDLLLFLKAFGTGKGAADLDEDEQSDSDDLFLFASEWRAVTLVPTLTPTRTATRTRTPTRTATPNSTDTR
jgi:beta-lactamase superfamily II metal-dependent hydrolase